MSRARPSAGIARWLWRDHVRPYRLALFAAIVLMVVEGTMLGAFSYLIKPMFDQVFTAGNRDAILWVGLGMSGVFVIRAGAAFGQRVLMVWVGQKVAAGLQNAMVGHLLRLDSAYFREHSPGSLLERVRGDSQAVVAVWERVLSALARDLVTLLALLAVAVSVDWLWTLIAVAAAPLLMLPINALYRRVRATTRASREEAARIATRLDEAFHGIDTIKLAGTETRERDRIARGMRGYIRAHLHSTAAQGAIVALIDLIAAVGFFGVLAYGGAQIIEGEKTIGEFMSFFTAMGLIFDPVRRLGNISGAWQAALASLERIRAVFDTRPTILSPARPRPAPNDIGHADIRFEAVSFSYGRTRVLERLNLTARAGETTALVGPSGAGKSTVFHLLTRLADAETGEITIGGAPVREMELSELRGLFSVVSQEALLFDESLRDNVLMGLEGVSPRALERALEAAHVSDFLDRLPRGLDSPAGPRGCNLSGGQRQRVAIARAILRDAPILLLDEATSALDARSERLVQEALERLSRGRTTLVIAHRLATIRQADRIVVMDRGRVVDQGNHAQLLDRGGLYADLCRLQFQQATDD